MRVFLAVLVLIFSFQSWTKADDIRDFEIERMSIGDSLLDYMTIDEIKQNTIQYWTDKKKYYVVGMIDNLKLFALSFLSSLEIGLLSANLLNMFFIYFLLPLVFSF